MLLAKAWHIWATLDRRKNFGNCGRPAGCYHCSALCRAARLIRVRGIMMCPSTRETSTTSTNIYTFLRHDAKLELSVPLPPEKIKAYLKLSNRLVRESVNNGIDACMRKG